MRAASSVTRLARTAPGGPTLAALVARRVRLTRYLVDLGLALPTVGP
jgi:hypothetical protein